MKGFLTGKPISLVAKYGEKFKETFPNMRVTLMESYVQVMGENYEFNNTYPLKWWNAEYKEPIIEHEQKIDKSAMMYEIYMQGVNMTGEYQGCWVRFKEIEKIVDKYVR